MSLEAAKAYIRQLRRDLETRRRFEAAWSAKHRQPDKKLRGGKAPIEPMLPTYAPDQKDDLEGHRAFWRLHSAQKGMHALLFSDGGGRDHAQDYLDGETITEKRIEEVMSQPDMEAVLSFFAALAGQEQGCEITLSEVKRAWLDYLKWIYTLTDYSGALHPEVQRLRKEAAANPELATAFNGELALSPMSLGAALAVQNFLECGFTKEEAYAGLERLAAALEAASARAGELGYDFSGLAFLKDCILTQQLNDPGPELDDKYWPEDDPNRWNYESPPVVFTV